MSDTVIQIKNLWKEYRLGVISHHTLTRDLQSWWARVCGKEDPNSEIGYDSSQITVQSPSQDRFCALQDISFEVKRGDLVGIVGRNGAGKSTLLKILSRVTAPTKGEVRFKGRIASLLEVGTGFHPELTGRENIFLNGAILGMSKSDIRKKLDEIIAFSEVGRFVDTPVKRYSSGMYVRLAFAVAAHLEPEILIVDEVLAVGDAAFQRKCLGKMGEVAGGGRTVLLVSHNMQAVRNLCNRGILIDRGRVILDGTSEEVVYHYLESGSRLTANALLLSHQHRIPADQFEICQVEILNSSGMPTTNLLCGEPFSLRFTWRIKREGLSYRIGALFRAMDETRLATVVSSTSGDTSLTGEKGKLYQTTVRLQNPFLPGTYTIDVNAKNSLGSYVDAIDGIMFTVESVAMIKGEAPVAGGHIWLAADWSQKTQETEGVIL